MIRKDIKIVVADDHPLLLKGLIDELKDKAYTVLPGASNGAEALQIITDEEPTVAILDVEMPLLSGFEVIKKAVELPIETKFIVLTSHKEKAFVIKAQKLAVSGYLLKDEPFSEIDRCIQAVVRGENYFSKVFDAVMEQQVNPQLDKIKFLSPSERTIVRLIAQEKTSNEIAALLSISPRTVQKHRANIIQKLELPSGTDALTVWTSENKELLLAL